MYRYKRSCKHPNNTQKRVWDYKEIDRSLPVLSKLHLDVMISIDNIIFKQGVQHLNLVWFLPSKCKVLSREMESCYITGIFNFRVCIFYLKTYAPVIACFSQRERGGEGAIPMGNETILKNCCLITHSCISMWYVFFVTV